jgi:hypothetical protein
MGELGRTARAAQQRLCGPGGDCTVGKLPPAEVAILPYLTNKDQAGFDNGGLRTKWTPHFDPIE